MTPPDNSRIIVVSGNENLAKRGADLFQDIAVASFDRRSHFTVAVSGGSSPRPMYRLLAEGPYRSSIPWPHTHLFWADERLVPETHPASNFGGAQTDFLQHLPIPSENIHPMTSTASPVNAAENYEHELRRHFSHIGSAEPVFDLILLGVGEDGHTASIFPDDRRAVDTTRWVTAVEGGSPRVERLTLTLPVIDQARCIVFLVSGSKKAPVVHSLLTDPSGDLPPQMIDPQRGNIVWLLDEDAAARLPASLPGYARKN